VIAELMKNSRINNGKLAKAVGVTPNTVTRIIKTLERKGLVQEYTMIPNFGKIGYTILAMTFVKLKRSLSDQDIEQAKKLIRETAKVMPLEVIMLERGMGMDFDGVIISYHTSLSSHMRFLDLLKGTGYINVEKLEAFRVNLQDHVRFIPLSFSLLAQAISTMNREDTVKP
jgi:DNA-binding Lrp family transcriptional regulator